MLRRSLQHKSAALIFAPTALSRQLEEHINVGSRSRLLSFVSVTHYNADYYSLADHKERCRAELTNWLTDSGQLNHKVVAHSASSLARLEKVHPSAFSDYTII